MVVYVGINEVDPEIFLDQMTQAEEFTEAVLVDVIDGKMVDRVTVGMDELANVVTKVEYGVHLMVEEPREYLNVCKEAGVSLVMGQIELMSDQKLFLKEAEKLSLKAGLALQLETPIDFIEMEAMNKLERILLLAIPIGFSQQAFHKQVLDKVKQLRESGFKGEIIIDGGVNEETIEDCLEAGADGFAVASGIWKSGSPKKAYEKLNHLVKSYEV